MWYCLILEGIWRVFFLYNPFCQFLIPKFSVWSTQAMINWNQSNHSFIPGLPHSFHRLQYGNARRAWYIVSHGHDVSDKVTKAKFRAFFKPTTCLTLVVNDSSSGIFALPSSLSPYRSNEITYHNSHWFSVLQAMTSRTDKKSTGCGNGCRV